MTKMPQLSPQFPDINLQTLNGQTGFVWNGENSGVAGDESGFRVSTAGDVNGDSIADFIIGAPGHEEGVNNAGFAYVVFGHAGAWEATNDLSNLNGNNGFKLIGENTGDLFGCSVSTAGDVNGENI